MSFALSTPTASRTCHRHSPMSYPRFTYQSSSQSTEAVTMGRRKAPVWNSTRPRPGRRLVTVSVPSSRRGRHLGTRVLAPHHPVQYTFPIETRAKLKARSHERLYVVRLIRRHCVARPIGQLISRVHSPMSYPRFTYQSSSQSTEAVTMGRRKAPVWNSTRPRPGRRRVWR